MTLPLQKSELARLGKLLAMIGSKNDPEALTAARMADELVRRLGATWGDILETRQSARQPKPVPFSDAAKLNFALEHSESLTDWEREFCLSLSKLTCRLSFKQANRLTHIARKVAARVPA